MSKQEKLLIVSTFINAMKVERDVESCLSIHATDLEPIHSDSSSFEIARGLTWPSQIGKNKKYDLIFGDFPFGMNSEEYQYGDIKLKIKKNWIHILTSLNLLGLNGISIFLIEPIAFSTKEGAKFEALLNSNGYFVNAFFNAPQGLYEPHTSLTPVFVVISRKDMNSVFIGELLSENQAREIVKNFFIKKESSNLANGIFIQPEIFRGFDSLKFNQQIDKLKLQFSEYEDFALGDVAIQINYVKPGQELEEIENSIYVPKIGKSSVLSKISDAKLKHHNYFQVVLPSKAKNEYVASFFKSDLGRLILNSLISRSIIPHLSKSELINARIVLPRLEDQNQIIITQRKLHELKRAIDNFDAELALNPPSSKTILFKLDNMLDSIGGLTDADRVRNIIRQGESKGIEFKETLSLDVKKNTKEKYIELSVLKTIVAFLNTEGGILLVGVNDAAAITGINNEIEKFHKLIDKYLLHFKNLIKARIGEEFYPYIDYKPINLDGTYILEVKCLESKSPCYLDNSEFYVRTNPATDKLEGPKLVEYVRHHFKQ